MVLLERIELSTSSLPMTRSTTELQQPGPGRSGNRIGGSKQARAIVAGAPNVKRGLMHGGDSGTALLMGESKGNDLSREERLAAKLRENLRRRKAQSRAKRPDAQSDPRSDSNRDSQSRDRADERADERADSATGSDRSGLSKGESES